jgi:uncharacterized protein (DUF608 family)
LVKIRQRIEHQSGIPLGGIGTGTVEVRPDGLFHEWQIFNTGPWSPNSPCCRKEAVQVSPDDLIFIVRTKAPDGAATLRYLALREQLHDLYSFPWLKCVESIVFEAAFPVARLTYEDDDLPVEIRGEFFSPFIPNDSRNSGTPGFYANFSVRNPTNVPIEVSFLGCIASMSGIGQEGRIPRNALIDDGETVRVLLRADGLDEQECTTGEMAFSASGGEVTHITGAFRGERNLRFWKSRYGLKVYSCLHGFRDDGKLPNLSPESAPALPYNFSAEKLSAEERKKLFAEMLNHPLGLDKFQRIRMTISDLADNDAELTLFLDDLAVGLRELKGREWGEAALCTRLEVEPGASKDALFTVGWFFANHLSPNNGKIGHVYENWFEGALDVSRHLTANFADFRRKTLVVPEMLYGSSLDDVTADAVSAQLSTLTKCTWWTKAGHFGVWEGLGCCGFHTMDISYQGSFPILALFPDLQKMQMAHGAMFQREDGRVHHFFIPDFSAVDNGFDRVDMNPQFVMMAARDYQWTADRKYLEQLWPHIVMAMDNSALLDGDGDGLPDRDTKRNTYDVWDFSGAPAYISSLWLGALKAAVRLAREIGDEAKASEWHSMYERGVESFESKLWNGEYYILWRDETTGRVDECCMSDQISGDWFCGVMGWGPICRPDRIRKALGNIMRYNFKRDHGLINASYPPGVPQRQPTSGNMQAEATWTGIEYTVAALLIEYGMIDRGVEIVRDIHNRYLRAGRFWNHLECGGHYYRALSSWTLLLALSGFRLDVPLGEIAFSPAVKSSVCAYPFFAPGMVGVYRQTAEGQAEVELKSGSLVLKKLSVPYRSGFDKAPVTLNSVGVGHQKEPAGDLLGVDFDSQITLGAGDIIRVG